MRDEMEKFLNSTRNGLSRYYSGIYLEGLRNFLNCIHFSPESGCSMFV
jgi:hypothetical protein